MLVHFDLPASGILLQNHVGEVSVSHPQLRLHHDVSNIVLWADVLKLDHTLVGKVPEQLVLEVRVVGPLFDHKVTCHMHRPLVVHEHVNGKPDLCKLI